MVTGSTGFLGSNLISKITNNNAYEIYGVSKKTKNIILKNKNLTYIKLDITDIKKGYKLDIDFDYIINFAGNIDHKNKSQTYKAHYVGVKNLFKIINLKKLRLFIQIGSSLEYGKKKSPHNENSKCNPISHYGKAKLLASKFIQSKFNKYLILRPYQIYGPYQKKDRLIPIIIDGCLKNKSFPCSDGSQFRDFLFVDDFTNLIIKIINSKKLFSGIYNVGYGKPYNVKNIINLIQKKIKKGKPLFGKIKMRKEEMIYTYPDIKKIKKVYKWKPKTDINSGLKKTINFYAK